MLYIGLKKEVNGQNKLMAQIPVQIKSRKLNLVNALTFWQSETHGKFRY